jgi:hypothetical protein
MCFKDDNLCAATLQVTHVVVSKPSVERSSLGQFSLHVLELLAANSKRVHVTGDLIRRPHAFENDTTSLCSMAGATLREYRARLRETWKAEQSKQDSSYETLHGFVLF